LKLYSLKNKSQSFYIVFKAFIWIIKEILIHYLAFLN